MFQEEKLHYIFVILFPLGLVLPLLSAEVLFIVPSVFFNMLVDTGRFRCIRFVTDSDSILIPRHMSLIAAVFIFLSTLYSIKKLTVIFPKFSKQITISSIFLIASLVSYNDRFIFSEYFYSGDPQKIEYKPTPESINKIIALIPSKATVKSDVYIANHLYDRKEAYYNFNNMVATDYLIMTMLDMTTLNFTQISQIDSQYETLVTGDNISLYKNRRIAGP